MKSSKEVMMNLACWVIDHSERLTTYSQFMIDAAERDDVKTVEAYLDDIDSEVNSILEWLERMKEEVYCKPWTILFDEDEAEAKEDAE